MTNKNTASLSVLTWNVGIGTGNENYSYPIDELREILQGHSDLICCLQEVPLKSRENNQSYITLDRLNENFGESHTILSAYRFGKVCLVTMFPKSLSEKYEFTKLPSDPANKFALKVYLKDIKTSILNLHLKSGNSGQQQRKLEIQSVCNDIQNPQDTIICGDLNSPPQELQNIWPNFHWIDHISQQNSFGLFDSKSKKWTQEKRYDYIGQLVKPVQYRNLVIQVKPLFSTYAHRPLITS